MKKLLLASLNNATYKRSKISNESFVKEFLFFVLIILLSLILPLFSNAQWVKNVGPNSGSTFANNGAGNLWVNVGNANASDNSYATNSVTSSTTTPGLDATGFSFNIPSTATITGVLVQIEKRASNNGVNNYVVDNMVQLINGGTFGTNKADVSTKWSTTDSYISYGGSTDTWGTALTPATINSTAFGVRIRAYINVNSGTRVAYIDHIRITVYYKADTDGDGIRDDVDIDSDNDGIADYLETVSSAITTDLFWQNDGDDISVISITNGPVTVTGGLSTTSCYSTATVSSTAYSALPDNTIYLYQDVCAMSEYSTMTINFNYPVSNLSFSIQDIDAYNPQFTDSVTINVSYKGVVYPLSSANYTVTPTFNKYVGSNTFVGLQNADNFTTNGQVLFNFPVMIDKIEITYRNNDPAIGQQAIGLSKLQFSHLTDSDTDGDGIPNYLDLDSDNDGVPDVIESYGVDANGDGKIDNFTDANANGLSDNAAITNTKDGIGIPDLDGDGIPNYIDLDSDGDGIPDVVEAGGTDTNNDGKVDGFTDTNGNGYQDALDGASALIKSGADTNGDGKADSWPNKNMDLTGRPNPYDLDSDGDGILDVVEAGFSGTNGIATGVLGSDGWSNTIDALGSLGLINTDAHGNPNYLDIDSDNDGITDNVEGQSTSSYIVPTDTDTDNDGIADVYETGAQIGTYGGGGLTPFDFDGDGTPDFRDTDTDNDGVPDRNEGDRNLPFKTITQATINGGLDTDGDGLMDVFDNQNITTLSAGSYYKNVSMGNMGPGGNFAGPTPTGSLIGLQQSNPTMDRDWRNATILPLNIVSFTANMQNDIVALSWVVENEYQTAFYDVEYSVDGNSFSKVQTVTAKNTGKVTYSFNHTPTNYANIVYYRIKQTDKNNRIFYTNIIAVKLNKAVAVSVYPNPFTQYFTVSINSKVDEEIQLQLISIDGKTIKNISQKIQKGINQIQINNLQYLTKGNYYLKIVSPSLQFTQPIIKVE